VVWDLADSFIAERRATGAEGTDLVSRLPNARDPDTGEALRDADVREEGRTAMSVRAGGPALGRLRTREHGLRTIPGDS
jgi:hypothetical protein